MSLKNKDINAQVRHSVVCSFHLKRLVCKGVAHGKCRTAAGHCLGAGSMPDTERPPSQSVKPVAHTPATNSGGSTTEKSGVGATEPKPATNQHYAKAAYDFPPENDRELELKVPCQRTKTLLTVKFTFY